ncbi:unnamed protein product [Protopolystoma xenopodis]|uniref:Uncharacterized protein n=1 Tax=Protopolystoma xenopodis TaxID=117903 RepID=A0A3S5BYS7_9PLAT|nr:unnamed protein product [Protopolystoma xenopodis]
MHFCANIYHPSFTLCYVCAAYPHLPIYLVSLHFCLAEDLSFDSLLPALLWYKGHSLLARRQLQGESAKSNSSDPSINAGAEEEETWFHSLAPTPDNLLCLAVSAFIHSSLFADLSRAERASFLSSLHRQLMILVEDEGEGEKHEQKGRGFFSVALANNTVMHDLDVADSPINGRQIRPSIERLLRLEKQNRRIDGFRRLIEVVRVISHDTL